jgi:hypothetical protein
MCTYGLTGGREMFESAYCEIEILLRILGITDNNTNAISQVQQYIYSTLVEA